MSNIYDQFDAPSASNPYDQFDPPAQGPAASGPNPYDRFDAGAPTAPQRSRTFLEALEGGFHGVSGSVARAIEYTGERTGSDTLTQFGREQAEEIEAEQKKLPPAQKIADVRGAGDFLQWLKETAGEAIPNMALPIIGGIAGAAAAPAAIPSAVAIGTGAAVAGLPLGIGEVQQKVKEKDPNAVAPLAPLLGGTAIAALDSVVPAKIGSMLVRSLGREVGEEVAKRALLKAGGKAATAEGLTEAVQEAIGEVSGSLGAEKPVDWAKLPEQMLEAGAKGFAIGGAFGAGANYVATRPHQPEPKSGSEPNDNAVAGSTADSAAVVEPGSIRVVDNPGQQQTSPFELEDRPEPSPIFYSQIERLVREKGPNFATSEQWMNTIRNWTQQGVKQEEIEWLRLPEKLADSKGRISKQDLLTHIQDNLVEVETIERTAIDLPKLTWTQVDETTWQVPNTGEYVISQGTGPNGQMFWVYSTNNPDGDERVIDRAPTLARAQEIAQAHSNRIAAEVDGQATPLYEGYQLEGEKQGYSELILTLNSNFNLDKEVLEANAAYAEARKKTDDAYQRAGAAYGGYRFAPLEVQQELDALQAAEDAAYNRTEELHRKRLKAAEEEFRGSHWEEPNVLAHVRISRRLDAEGKMVLYVEEIQSDWHQQGRKSGYRGSIDTSKWRVEHHTRTRMWGVTGAFDVWRIFEVDGRLLNEVHDTTREEAIRLTELAYREGAVPNAPFKGSAWAELAIKRILRYAADNGFERVAFTTGAIQSRRWQAAEGSQRARGFEEFYDNIVPRYVAKWAKKLGGRTGMTSIPTNVPAGTVPNDFGLPQPPPPSEPAMFVDISPQMASRIKLGFTTFELRAKDDGPGRVSVVAPQGSSLLPAAQKGAEIVQQLARRFKIRKPIEIRINRGLGGTNLGSVMPVLDTRDLEREITAGRMTFEQARDVWDKRLWKGQAEKYIMNLWPDKFETVEEMFSNFMHELGHIIAFEFYHRADANTQLALDAKYQEWFRENNSPTRKFRELLVSRQIFIRTYYNQRMTMDPKQDPLVNELQNSYYWLSKAEWMAETVGRYMVTQEKPLSVVDRFFSALSRTIRTIRDEFAKKFGLPVDPPDVMTKWLDSLITLEPLDYGAAEAERNRRTQEANQRAAAAAGHPDFPATPQTPESVPLRRLLGKLGMLGHTGAAMNLAAVDRFSTFHKYMLSLQQVSARNLHIEGLQRYRELWQLKQLERANLMNVALETKRMWGKLKQKESDDLGRMMDWYANGHFLPDDEAQNGVVRRPTQAEYAEMRRRFNITDAAWNVFLKVQADFDMFLDEVEKIELAEAQQITDAAAQARAMLATRDKFNEYRKRPYMPFMRYGDYTLTVRDSAGAMTGFYTFESQSKRRVARKAIEHDLLPGETISEGVLPEDVRPLMGLPPGLLDKVRDRLGLTPAQITALEQLKFEFTPVQSFKHRFARRNATPGYSLDFQRGYMNYFFFGSNYLTNVKYAQPLLEQIKAVRDSARPLADGTRRGRIANFMTDHYHYTMNPKADWATFRQMATLWALGGVPAAATLNLSQIVIGSFPFLASKFGGIGRGDARAVAALGKAGAQLSSYYKRGSLEAGGMTEADLRALSEGVKEGIITEALAHELAAAAEKDNLKPYVWSKGRDTFNWILEKSMWMFEMTEQMNRRITFRAAWRLALEHPDQPYVAEAVEKHRLAYERLLEKGWNRNEAAAFVVAKDTVEQTQFIYQQWASPRFMRGRLRTVFIFKSFVQNTLFSMYNNPGAGARTFLLMAFLGGLMGVPGAEDLRGIIKMLAYRLFGKDFDIEEEARKFVVELMDGKIPPDLVLHGAARRGFGLPAAMDLVGVPFPAFDRSKAIGLGHILPVDFGVLGGPHKDTSRAIAESAQKASGAAFGIGFNLYKFLTDSQLDWNDSKRWQMALPRSLQGAVKGWRYYDREEEVNRFGNRVVRFDTDDPRHMAEIIGAAMGYQPMRLAAQWDRIMAEREAIMYWNIRRETLMRQLWAARGDEKQYESMLQNIRNFNAQLPDHAALKRITADAIRRSFQQRERSRTVQESGTPRVRADVPIVREIQRLYPEAEVDVRRVR